MTLIPKSTYISFPELGSNPSTPAASNVKMFATNSGTISIIDSSGTTVSITGGADQGSDLKDFVITAPVDTDYLKYDSGDWVNANFPFIATELNELTDVDTTGEAEGYTLTRIGTEYRPKKNQAGLAVWDFGFSEIGGATADDGDGLSTQFQRIGDGSGRYATGDDILLEDAASGSMYIPISDDDYDDHGLYMMYGWFKINYPFESAGDPPTSGYIRISWVNLDNLTIDDEVILYEEDIQQDETRFIFVRFPFKSDASVASVVRRYAFRIFTTETSATYWQMSAMEKISHAYA